MVIQNEWEVRLIDAREVAERLGLSIWTVYAWARTGRIPSVRLVSRRTQGERHQVPRAPSEARGSCLPNTLGPTPLKVGEAERSEVEKRG